MCVSEPGQGDNMLELGQIVSISKYRDTIRYRYQTFTVSKYQSIECQLISSIIPLYLDTN